MTSFSISRGESIIEEIHVCAPGGEGSRTIVPPVSAVRACFRATALPPALTSVDRATTHPAGRTNAPVLPCGLPVPARGYDSQLPGIIGVAAGPPTESRCR